ncbi:MAG: hypothetical protein HY320_05725 [Armatimonadetes bacterium]|nr:hypothetical protein [Armatimonadota bacterium]
MEHRNYDPARDREAVHRIWREVGWLEKGQEEALDLEVACSRALVADLNGEAECLVTTLPGTIRYLAEDLPLSCVISVTTSRIARKQRFAIQLTALAVAADAAQGALVSALGMFEQGYYNQIGFGTLGYSHRITFDPTQLTVPTKARVPRRLSPEDWAMVHASRLARQRGHGACTLLPAEFTRAAMLYVKNGFGLGYGDGPHGELTHHFWCGTRNVSHGPYWVEWLVFQTPEQFLELMALIKSLGDQVHLVSVDEPAGIQLQDLLERPFRYREVTEKSQFEHQMRAWARMQARICDLPGCLARTHLRGGEVRFNLRLADPIGPVLENRGPWRGCAGDYVVTLGPSSGAERGRDAALPMLRASVGAFTRLWLGVRPATGLAVTDDLSGPRELLEELDRLLRLPDPHPDWDF